MIEEQDAAFVRSRHLSKGAGAEMSESVGTSVEARLEALEARLRYLEDVREINELMRKWHYACTGGFNGIPTHRTAEAIALFVEDGSIEVQGLNEPGKGPRGRAELLEYYQPFHGPDGVLPHVYQTGIDYGVEVNGDTAVQESNLLCITKYKDGSIKPEWYLGRYRNEYVRTPEGWKFKNLRLEACYTVPADDLKPAEANRGAVPKAVDRQQPRLTAST